MSDSMIVSPERLEENFIMADIKEKLHEFDVRKVSYAYIVMVLLQTSLIGRDSNILQAISRVQEDLDAIINDLKNIKSILQQLQGLSWGKDDTDPTKDYDPTKHADSENISHMHLIINTWLTTPSDGQTTSP
ncbi:MAG: hypothetical protein ACD_20C00252G0001, partial [uncultured bacterium]